MTTPTKIDWRTPASALRAAIGSQTGTLATQALGVLDALKSQGAIYDDAMAHGDVADAAVLWQAAVTATWGQLYTLLAKLEQIGTYDSNATAGLGDNYPIPASPNFYVRGGLDVRPFLPGRIPQPSASQAAAIAALRGRLDQLWNPVIASKGDEAMQPFLTVRPIELALYAMTVDSGNWTTVMS